jgi:hypothetical protein
MKDKDFRRVAKKERCNEKNKQRKSTFVLSCILGRIFWCYLKKISRKFV